MDVPLVRTFAFAFAGQLLPALIFIPLQTERYYDLCGSLGFLTTTAFSLYSTPTLPPRLDAVVKNASILDKLFPSFSKRAVATIASTVPSGRLFFGRHPRQLIASACVAVWAVRLGSFLFARMHRTGHDPRFDSIKRDPLTFAFAWTMQAVWVGLTALPVYMLNTTLAPNAHPVLGWFDALALLVWTFGFALEVVADRTKTVWRAEREAGKHEEAFLTRGVWSWSRHPNYFGEITLWTGLALLAVVTLRSDDVSSSRSFVVVGDRRTIVAYRSLLPLLSPLFEYALIRYLSGVPMLEREQDRKMGDDAKYKAYKARVPCFVPFVGSTT